MPPTLRETEEIFRTHTGTFRIPLSRCVPRIHRYFSRPDRNRSDPSPEEYSNLEVIEGFKPIYTGYDCHCCITNHLINIGDVILWDNTAPKGRATFSPEGYALHTGQQEAMLEHLRSN